MIAFVSYVLMLAAIYGILALSLDILVGHLGLVSLAQAAFFGIGAYAAGFAANTMGANLLDGLGLAVICGAAASLVVSIPSLRLRGDYFVISAFAFQMLMFSLFNNLVDLTGGPLGLSIASPAATAGDSFVASAGFLAVSACVAVMSLLTLGWIGKSRYGRILRAIRNDEILAGSFGINTARAKISAFALSAGIAAAAGAVFASYMKFIDPTSFSVFESVSVLTMVLLWRPATIWGPVLGAAFLVSVPELLRFANIATSEAASLQQVTFGVVLIIVVFFRGRFIFVNATGAGT